MKWHQHLSPLTAFLGFLSFNITLYFLLVASMVVALIISLPGAGEDALQSFFWLISLFVIFTVVIFGSAPLWGKKIISYFTATNPGYWKVSGLAVWLPFFLVLLSNTLVGLLFGEASPWFQLGALLFLYLGSLAFASSIYYGSEQKE